MSAIIDQPPGPFSRCETNELGAYWQPGRWTRDKLRGRALTDSWIREEYGVEPSDVFRARFNVGWMIERVEHDGEWCDPRWPAYFLETTEPEPNVTAMEVSWLEFE